MANRDGDGRFLKGNSVGFKGHPERINTTGRTAGATRAFRKLDVLSEEAADFVAEQLRHGDPSSKKWATEIIATYTWKKPAQHVTVEEVTTDELAQRLRDIALEAGVAVDTGESGETH